jgi:hypothetical protein
MGYSMARRLTVPNSCSIFRHMQPSSVPQYLIALLALAVVTVLNLLLLPVVGYHTVGFAQHFFGAAGRGLSQSGTGVFGGDIERCRLEFSLYPAALYL